MTLEIGDPCWIEHHRGTLVAKVDDKFHVRADKDGVVRISALALPDDDFTPAPFYCDAHQVVWQFVKRYCWFRDNNLAFVYCLRTPYNCSRHGDDRKLSRSELCALTPTDNPYSSDEDVEDALAAIDDEAEPIRAKISSLEAELTMIFHRKHAVRARCNHKWEVGEEEEGKMGMIGRSCSRTDTCTKCEHTNHLSYTRL